MTRVYYNDNEEYVCNWLANLMLDGLIPEGDIDQRSIRDVTPGDLRGYTQYHFFAGLGGWPYALQLAEWPNDREVWTGSCPCQPFSVAGKQKGFDDERHVWPDFRRLVAQCKPPVLFGEQVAGASQWLNVVRSDLEAVDYAVGAIPIEAASAGADHFRDRYFFVADRAQQQQHRCRDAGTCRRNEYSNDGHGKLADRDREHEGDRWIQRSGQLGRTSCDQGNNGWALSDDDDQRSQESQRVARNLGQERPSTARSRVCFVEHGHDALGRSGGAGRDDDGRHAAGRFQSDDDDDDDAKSGYAGRFVEHGQEHGWGEGWTEHEFRRRGFTAAVANIGDRQYLECPDGKWRRLPPPRVRWLGNGIPSRVAKLRAIGNAIDPRPAAAFIKAYLACQP